MNLNKNTHPKLQTTIEKMCIDLHYGYPFFGEYNLMLDFVNSTVYCPKCKGEGHEIIEDKKEVCTKCKGTKYGKSSIDTCAVNVTNTGMNFYWNEAFLNPLTQTEVTFVDIHELFHLILNHPQRTIAGRLDNKLTNIAQDMIINHTIWVDVMKKNKNHFFCQIPKYEKNDFNDEKGLTGKNIGVFLPKEYTGEHIFEYLYIWLKEKHKEWKKEQEKKNACKSCSGSGKKDDQTKKDGDQNKNGNKPSNDGQGKGDKEQGDGGGGKEPCPDCNGSGKQEGQGQGDGQGKGQGQGQGNGDKNDEYGDNGLDGVETWTLDGIFRQMEANDGQFMDAHIADEVPQEVRDQITHEAVERLRSRGLVKGDLEQVLQKLRKKRKDYLGEIKRSISNEILGTHKQKSITRPNRRGIFGLKGNIKVKSKINVILDTSGSMSGLHTKVLSYIYRNDIECNLIQCDTCVHSVTRIKKKKDLETIKLKGFGGTIIQPAVDVVVDKFNKYNTVILTDGFTDSLNMSKIKGRVLIITTDNECPISSRPMKGLKQIIVDEKYH